MSSSTCTIPAKKPEMPPPSAFFAAVSKIIDGGSTAVAAAVALAACTGSTRLKLAAMASSERLAVTAAAAADGGGCVSTSASVSSSCAGAMQRSCEIRCGERNCRGGSSALELASAATSTCTVVCMKIFPFRHSYRYCRSFPRIFLLTPRVNPFSTKTSKSSHNMQLLRSGATKQVTVTR